MFDINQLEISDTADYHVTDAKGNPQYDGDTPITITLHSPGTERAARAQFKRDEANRARTFAQMGGKVSKRTEADENRERAEFLAEITSSLNSFSYPTGFKGLYMNLKLGHIADGVEKFFNDRGNFSGNSAPISSSTSVSSPG